MGKALIYKQILLTNSLLGLKEFKSRNSIVYYTWAWSKVVCSNATVKQIIWTISISPPVQRHLRHGHRKEQIFYCSTN